MPGGWYTRGRRRKKKQKKGLRGNLKRIRREVLIEVWRWALRCELRRVLILISYQSFEVNT
jgi:hypothetical protein